MVDHNNVEEKLVSKAASFARPSLAPEKPAASRTSQPGPCADDTIKVDSPPVHEGDEGSEPFDQEERELAQSISDLGHFGGAIDLWSSPPKHEAKGRSLSPSNPRRGGVDGSSGGSRLDQHDIDQDRVATSSVTTSSGARSSFLGPGATEDGHGLWDRGKHEASRARKTTPLKGFSWSAPRKRPSSIRIGGERLEARIGLIVDDRYRIMGKLGEGGMGTVFVAEQMALGRQVALKIIRKEHAEDGEIAARFAREAMVGGQLDHPNIASTIDYGSLPDGSAYIAMQFAKGSSLSALLRERSERLGWETVCEIVVQIADALHTAHLAGVVHRDLKPDNIILEEKEHGYFVTVLDFGMARINVEKDNPSGRSGTSDDPSMKHDQDEAAVTELTYRGAIMGTLGYMAPEQAAGNPADHRADMYSLGVMMWEMLVGKPLFATRSRIETLAAQLLRTPPPVQKAAANPDLPEALGDLVDALLTRDPVERTLTALDVRDVCMELAGLLVTPSMTSLAPPSSYAPRMRRSRPSTSNRLKLPLPGPRRKTRSLWPWALGVGGLILGIASMTLAFWPWIVAWFRGYL